MHAPATSLWAALLGLLYFALTVRIIRERRARQLDMGTGGDRLMMRFVRAHGNFAETVPLALILLLLLEFSNSPAWLIHSLGMCLLVGRMFHAWSFSFAELRLGTRTIGVLLTQGMTLLTAVLLLAGVIWR